MLLAARCQSEGPVSSRTACRAKCSALKEQPGPDEPPVDLIVHRRLHGCGLPSRRALKWTPSRRPRFTSAGPVVDEAVKARWDVDEWHGLAVLGRAHRLVISPARRRAASLVNGVFLPRRGAGAFCGRLHKPELSVQRLIMATIWPASKAWQRLHKGKST